MSEDAAVAAERYRVDTKVNLATAVSSLQAIVARCKPSKCHPKVVSPATGGAT